jgi:hypothetical protein
MVICGSRKEPEALKKAARTVPCAIIMSVVSEEGARRVGVCPITHSTPLSLEDRVAVPLAAARRLGLDDEPCWIMVSEINTFQWPGHDIRPDRDDKVSLGFLPPKLFEIIKARLVERAERHSLGSINRD